MKIETNKIIFTMALSCIVLFIVVYATLIMDGDAETPLENHQIPLPTLETDQKTYESKLEALNDLKEVKQTQVPSIYDDQLLDSSGVYDPDLLDKEKLRMIDSVYQEGRMAYLEKKSEKHIQEPTMEAPPVVLEAIKTTKEVVLSAKALGLEHQLFFGSHPPDQAHGQIWGEPAILVAVDGTQTVKAHHRLRMRLVEDAVIQGVHVPRHTPLYGFVSFRPNRTILDIETINHQAVTLKAYDLQDGQEGVYMENSFRAEATKEVVEDVVQDINMAGFPQVGGVRKLFQRDNRSVKVTVLNNYQLILKVP